MKKKLLLVLTTILLAITTFTSNVFADDVTISSIIPDDFPINADNAWVCEEGYGIYRSNDDLFFSMNDTTFQGTTVLTQEGNNYKYSNTTFPTYDLIFEMNSSGVLQKIHINNVIFSGNNFTLEPLSSNKKTILQILNSYASGFPVTSENGLVNESNPNRTIYRDNTLNVLSVDDNPDNDYDFILPLLMPLVPYDSGYKTYYDEYDVRFVINNSRLESIQIVDTPDVFEHAKGTYLLPITVADFLPSNFPTCESEDWGVDSNYVGWTNGTLYIYKEPTLNRLKLSPGANYIELSTPVTIEGSNYVIENSVGKFTFVMNNNELTKIVGSNFPNPYETVNGEYLPQVTVRDLASVLCGDSSQFGDFRFVKDENKEAKIDNNMLYVGGNDSLSINNPLTKEGNDYSYTSPLSPYPKFLFKMTNGKLSSIVLSSSATSESNGTYVPYDFQEPRTDYPIGYTGDITFIVNAPFSAATGAKIKIGAGSDATTQLTLNDNYTLTQGSVKVTLLSDYVQTLTESEYTLSLKLRDYPIRYITFRFSNSSSGGGGSGSSGHVVLNTGVSIKDIK